MKALHSAAPSLISATALMLASACVPAPAPTPAPSPSVGAEAEPPVPTPTPAVTPSAAPTFAEPEYANYLDAPVTAGGWEYRDLGFATQAHFAADTPNAFLIQCLVDDPASEIARVGFMRPGEFGQDLPLAIRAETAERQIAATQTDFAQSNGLVAFLPARDPLLDAIALTRGRFAVETPGMPTLYLPAWAEVTRVIEDCR